jgi:hypothetical protein
MSLNLLAFDRFEGTSTDVQCQFLTVNAMRVKIIEYSGRKM